MSSFNGYSSPFRPIPQFFNDCTTFTTKKARYNSTPCPKKVPPRPPSKSVPPISRFFSRPNYETAQAISFKDNNSDSSLSKHYDSSREESYFEQCFHVESKIGSGSFGDVFKVKSVEDGKYYAIKRSRESFKGKSDRERQLEEVYKHEQLPRHPNCVRFVKAWEERQHLYIQTELCQISLSDFAEHNHDIPESVVCNYLVDLLKAVRHLHYKDLIHLDIKPENIFISSEGICKLGDFGLVLDISRNDTNEATEGDPKYLAKELMQGQFTKAADIFSLGLTILEISCDLDVPSGGEVWHQLRDGNIPDHLLSGISNDLSQTIKDMMDPDYRHRPSAEELLCRPFIRRIERSRRWKLRVKRSQKQDIETPSKPIKNNSKYLLPNDFDSNYSDDDFLDTSSLSAINDSKASEISSNSDRFSVLEDSFNSHKNGFKQNFCSTQVFHRHRGLLDTSLPSPSFTPSSPIQRIYESTLQDSPTLLREPLNRHKPIISQKLNFDDQSDDDSSDWDKSYNNNMGPKNLLNTFDEIEDDVIEESSD